MGYLIVGDNSVMHEGMVWHLMDWWPTPDPGPQNGDIPTGWYEFEGRKRIEGSTINRRAEL